MNWPLTGGIPSLLFYAENYQVERVYAAGYQDGSVRIWDATYPTFSLIHVLGPEVSILSQFCNFHFSNAIDVASLFCIDNFD